MEQSTHVEQDSISKKARNNKLIPMIGCISSAFILGMLIWLIILVFTISRDTHTTQRNILERLEAIAEEQEQLSELMQSHAEESKRQFGDMQENRRLEELVENYEAAERRRYAQIINRLTTGEMQTKEDDERIIGILVEKTKYDYVESGLEYYEKQAYSQAYTAFSQALTYDTNDTTVLFYKIYCLYLASMNTPVEEDTYEIIFDGIQVINEYGYQKNETLHFTEDEMREMTDDMSINITEWQRKEGEEVW